MESKTPLTDNEIREYEGSDRYNSFQYVEPDFARKLELDRAALIEFVKSLPLNIQDCGRRQELIAQMENK